MAEDIVDSPSLREFLTDYSPSTDPLELAVNKNLIDRKSFKPKVAGVLLFATEPACSMQKKCSVRIVRYETKEDDPERDHLGAIEAVEGPIYNVIHCTIDQVTTIMSSINVWTTDGPKAMAYPAETLWEIVVNAIIHRDYSIPDAPPQIIKRVSVELNSYISSIKRGMVNLISTDTRHLFLLFYF